MAVKQVKVPSAGTGKEQYRATETGSLRENSRVGRGHFAIGSESSIFPGRPGTRERDEFEYAASSEQRASGAKNGALAIAKHHGGAAKSSGGTSHGEAGDGCADREKRRDWPTNDPDGGRYTGLFWAVSELCEQSISDSDERDSDRGNPEVCGLIAWLGIAWMRSEVVLQCKQSW